MRERRDQRQDNQRQFEMIASILAGAFSKKGAKMDAIQDTEVTDIGHLMEESR